MKEENKSCELIGSCLDLFMRFGIKSLTMADISKKLGISKKTLYQFVSDKKELVFKGMTLCLEEEKEVLAKVSLNCENAIDELIGFTRFVNSRLGDLHPSVIYDIQKYHPDSWAIMQDHKQNFVRNSILENTKRGIKEGVYRENLNPEIVTSLYMLMMDGFFEAEQTFGKDVKLEDLHLEMIRYHVRGVANDAGITLLKETLNKKENNHLKLD
ncbi:MAG: TetR/AcrR family transcriptional regulator [Vicingaceae bacterium]|nr:TetR/AcrR family transcriptional regulator [Vicingaceae bacterium]